MCTPARAGISDSDSRAVKASVNFIPPKLIEHIFALRFLLTPAAFLSDFLFHPLVDHYLPLDRIVIMTPVADLSKTLDLSILRNKSVLITGGASGLGALIAIQFAENG